MATMAENVSSDHQVRALAEMCSALGQKGASGRTGGNEDEIERLGMAKTRTRPGTRVLTVQIPAPEYLDFRIRVPGPEKHG
ncbi:hypothetical protein QYF36_025883 [Acer negundo]|nr:hypothetical protein QYF36_025883 [Acer negundo]